MKIEVFIGAKEASAVRYGRGISVPFRWNGKPWQVVVNLRWLVVWWYR